MYQFPLRFSHKDLRELPIFQITNGLLQFAKWATWLYYPNEGKEVRSKHLHGRTYQGAEKEAEKIALKRRQREDKMASGETRE